MYDAKSLFWGLAENRQSHLESRLETSWRPLGSFLSVLKVFWIKRKRNEGGEISMQCKHSFFSYIFSINLGVFLEAKVVLLLETSIKNRIGDICEFMTKSGPVGTCSWERSSSTPISNWSQKAVQNWLKICFKINCFFKSFSNHFFNRF